MKKIFVGITGASGALYGLKTVQELSRRDVEVNLCITPDGLVNLNIELGKNFSSADDFIKNFNLSNIINHDYKNFAAPVSSGSKPMDYYVVVPASMGCVGRIASGVSSNLIERCADVAMKESKKLILVVRETPFNTIHLQNMLSLSQAGVTIMPAAPGFYHKPKEIDDIISFIVGKIFDIMNISHNLFERWN